MKKLIELDAAIKATWKDTGYTDPLNVMTAIRDRIEALPTVDAVSVAHGWWKAVTDDGDEYKRICSCCGEEAPFDKSEDVYLLYPHCPWCGASLDIKGGNGNG